MASQQRRSAAALDARTERVPRSVVDPRVAELGDPGLGDPRRVGVVEERRAGPLALGDCGSANLPPGDVLGDGLGVLGERPDGLLHLVDQSRRPVDLADVRPGPVVDSARVRP